MKPVSKLAPVALVALALTPQLANAGLGRWLEDRRWAREEAERRQEKIKAAQARINVINASEKDLNCWFDLSGKSLDVLGKRNNETFSVNRISLRDLSTLHIDEERGKELSCNRALKALDQGVCAKLDNSKIPNCKVPAGKKWTREKAEELFHDTTARALYRNFESARKPRVQDLQFGRLWACSQYNLFGDDHAPGYHWVASSNGLVPTFRFEAGGAGTILNTGNTDLPSMLVFSNNDLSGTRNDGKLNIRVTEDGELLALDFERLDYRKTVTRFYTCPAGNNSGR